MSNGQSRIRPHPAKIAVASAMILLILLVVHYRGTVGISQEREQLSGAGDQIARISLVAGEVSYQRLQESESDWYEATLNLPLGESDQLYSGPDGRVEIQIGSGNVLRLAQDSNLRFTRFNPTQLHLSLPAGTLTIRLENIDLQGQATVAPASDPEQVASKFNYEISTPAAAITLNRKGVYRVNVASDGTTELIVREGQAEIFRQEIGSFIVGEGRTARVDGADPSIFAVFNPAAPTADDWDRWNQRRDDETARLVAPPAAVPVPGQLPGSIDLDRYGEWFDTPEYGRVWAPRGTDAAWAPYRLGYWRWYGTYGWTWISYEPWGWVPYHYGRWAWHRQRWIWVPSQVLPGNLILAGRPGVGWRWSPHQVVFIGWGESRYINGYRDGFRDGYWTGFRDGRGWLGWCPLAPGEDRDDQRPGRGDRLRNYQAPGGVSGIEVRGFTDSRIIRLPTRLVAPPREAQLPGSRGDLGIVSGVIRERDLQPNPSSRPTRTPLIEKIESRRALDLSRPLVERRPLAIPTRRDPVFTTPGGAAPPTRSNNPFPPPSSRPPVRSGSYTIPRTGTIPRREVERVDRVPPAVPRREPVPSRPGIFSRPAGSSPVDNAPRRETPPPVRSIPPRAQPSAPARGTETPARPTRETAPERPLRPSRELPPP